MDVLLLAVNDWANTGYRFYKCLRHLGLDVLPMKGQYHPFHYPEQIPIHPDLAKLEPNNFYYNVPGFKQFGETAKVLHYIASTFVNPGLNLAEVKNKNVVMHHGGRAYRVNHGMFNEKYNGFVNASLIQCPDLLGYGAVNEHLIYYPVDTDFIQPVFKPEREGKITVGHFPSIPKDKGTTVISKTALEVSRKSNGRIKYVGAIDEDFRRTGLLIWQDNLRRMAYCDVIVETVSMTAQNGLKYGEWGNTALEAAALGKIVVTNSLTADLYRKEYGRCELIIANDENQLREALTSISEMSDNDLRNKRELTRAWAEKYHSIPATAKRLWDKIYKDLLE